MRIMIPEGEENHYARYSLPDAQKARVTYLTTYVVHLDLLSCVRNQLEAVDSPQQPLARSSTTTYHRDPELRPRSKSSRFRLILREYPLNGAGRDLFLDHGGNWERAFREIASPTNQEELTHVERLRSAHPDQFWYPSTIQDI